MAGGCATYRFFFRRDVRASGLGSSPPLAPRGADPPIHVAAPLSWQNATVRSATPPRIPAFSVPSSSLALCHAKFWFCRFCPWPCLARPVRVLSSMSRALAVAASLPRASPLTIQLRSPAAAKPLRVSLPECDPSLRERTLPLASKALYLVPRHALPVRVSFVPAYNLLVLFEFGGH